MIRALDGPLALVSCVSQTAYAACEECVTERDCAVRRVFQQVRDETARILDGTTLAAPANRPTDDTDLANRQVPSSLVAANDDLHDEPPHVLPTLSLSVHV